MGTLSSNKLCKYCSKRFKPARLNQLYCRAYCRNKHWAIMHPTEMRQHNRAFRLRKILLCRECKKPISVAIRRNGLVFCSANCRRQRRLSSQNKHTAKCMKAFSKLKKKIGCCLCSYKRFSGSLDFHHIDATTKKHRIDCKRFVGMTAEVKQELKKCVLLCKNCHHELHWQQRHKPELYARRTNRAKVNFDKKLKIALRSLHIPAIPV